ncbi:AAA family ATPase [Clostridium felsineum]|uniref:AAA family ATPase n=1 Tax=Clostridium felsineum TaxID=36839 RepID=UPI00214D34A6|nr:AAA family ATPase [Clostridium felsineum]MCR3757882.1 AAA family ATPase [Clostridium felsineum]
MELIYLYIENFNGILKKQEVNFSPNYDVRIENNKLIVNNKVSYMDKLYPENIKNITMLLGKNGSGKTTLLDVIGMNWIDRCNKSIDEENGLIDSYFMLYHIQEDYFGIEIMDYMKTGDKITKLFQNSVTNFNFEKIKDPFYKIPMGLLVKKNNEKFEVLERFFSGYEISKSIKVNYISNKYSERIDTDFYRNKDEENYDYLGKRRYYIYSSKVMQYRYLNDINNTKELNFCGKSAIIHIAPKINYSLHNEDENEEIDKWINTLENILYLDKPLKNHFIRIGKMHEQNEKDTKNRKKYYKRTFILSTFSKYIIYQFVSGICYMIDSNIKINSENGVNIDFLNNDHIEFLNNLKKDEFVQSNSNFIFGKISNKNQEYENLIKVISYYKQDEELSDYDNLICISRYLYSRMESTINCGKESAYQKSIEEFFNSLKLLNKSYFQKKEVSIDCKLKVDEDVVKVLKIYDFYFENDYNDLRSRFNIHISNLSEGEKNFLILTSKIFDIIINSKENQLILILLDEPDQSLHPEWSRRFIKFICDKISTYENKNIQIVLATHSPFMATDIMSDHIYCLKNEKSRINIYSMSSKKDAIYNTFGANIYEILKDSFILEKTIGEFAYDKIRELINNLNKTENGNMDYEQFLINSIGELPLRKKLQYIYMEKRESQLKNNILDLIKIENDEEKLKKIKKILNGDEL